MQATAHAIRADGARLSRLLDFVFEHVRDHGLDLRDPRTSALYARIAEMLIDVDKEIAAHAVWIGKAKRRLA